MIKFFVALLVFFSAAYAEEPFAVYLTWQKDPTTTMSIQWITEINATYSGLEYKEEDTNASSRDTPEWILAPEEVLHLLPQKEPYILHVLELAQLKPNTSYRFRFTNDTQEFCFRTMPENLSEPIHFVVGGDTCQQGMSSFREMNVIAAKTNPCFVLFGGDLAYAAPRSVHKPEDGKAWLEWIRAYFQTMRTPSGHLIPLLVTIGNHDVKGHGEQTPKEAPFYYALFPMPGLPGYNSLQFGGYLTLFLLDSNHTNPIKGAQTEWLKNALQKHMTTHRLAIYHIPAYPSVRYFEMHDSASIRKHWVPLFEKYGVHLAFENHEHAYKRTFPLRGGRIDSNGVVYVGDGSWGTKPRTPKRPKDTRYLATALSVRQFTKVELSQTKREIWAITSEGEIVDHYVQEVK